MKGLKELSSAGKTTTAENSISRMILNQMKHSVHALIGAVVYYKLMRRKEKTHYLVVPPHIGDPLRVFSYLEAYKEKWGYEHCTVVSDHSSQVRQIIEFYHDAIDEVCYLPKRPLYYMSIFAQTWLGQSFVAYAHRDRITFASWTCMIKCRGVWQNDCFDLNRFVKELLLQIDPEIKGTKPCVPDVDLEPFIRDYGLMKGKTILLNNVAYTVEMQCGRLFENIAAALKNAGYTVAAVTAPNERVTIPGIQAFPCNLAEAYRLAEYCGTVLGVRSGFLDIMAMANCRVIAIDDANYVEKGFFNLEKCWGDVNPNCTSIVYDNNEDETLQAVLKLVDVY